MSEKSKNITPEAQAIFRAIDDLRPRHGLFWELGDRFCRLAVRAVYRSSPRSAMRLGSWFAPAMGRLTGRISSQMVADYLGDPLTSGLASAARRIRSNSWRNKMLLYLAGCEGLEPLQKTMELEGYDKLNDFADAGRPVILVLCHTGPTLMNSFALGHTRLKVLTLTGRPIEYRLPDNVKHHFLTLEAESSILELKRAVSHLKRGGSVVSAAEGFRGTTDSARPLLNTHLSLRRGISTMHELTGAPVVPIGVRWKSGGRMLAQARDPLKPSREGNADAMQEAIHEMVEAEHRNNLDQLWAGMIWLAHMKRQEAEASA